MTSLFRTVLGKAPQDTKVSVRFADTITGATITGRVTPAQSGNTARESLDRADVLVKLSEKTPDGRLTIKVPGTLAFQGVDTLRKSIAAEAAEAAEEAANQ